MSNEKVLTIKETFDLAVQNHQKNNIKEAQNLYNKILEIDPNHSQALNNIAIIFTNLKDYQKAKECYEKAIEINPNYADAHNNLGLIFKGLGKNQKAKECYKKAIEINPNHADAHNNLGVLFKEVGDLQKANECYEKAIEINPNDAKAYSNQGNNYKELGENQKAKECFEKAITISPNDADINYNLGNFFKLLKENEKAKKCYEKAIEINPDYTNANNQLLKSLYQSLTTDEVFNLAVKNHQEGKTDIAQEHYNQVLKIDPNHSQALNNIAIIFTNLKDYQKATNTYEKAIEIDPNYADAHYNLGTIFKELGEFEKAKNCYEKAIKINPNYTDAHNNLGVLFKELGDLQKAKECFEKAIKINPNDARAYSNQGNTYKELGEKQKAKECYEKAIEINPDYTNANNQLLKSLYQINNQSILFKKLESITKEGKMNAVIGSIFSRSNVKYGFKKNNPFCNDPLDYVLKISLIEKYDFKNVIVDCVHNILKDDSLSNRPQSLIENGYQTSGNLFANKDFNTKEIQRIIYAEIDKYRLKFRDSKEGFINNWPTNYNLKGWLISMKNGGKLKAHMHDIGWLSGSIYVNVPPKLQTDSGNLVVCIDENENENENENEKSIDVVTGSLCLFPSSLLHYTIPFESEEERIVLAFDMVPN